MKIRRQLLAEFLGSAGLLIVVVGSGIMGESLAHGNDAIALLANSLATGAGLFALIQTFGAVSGAHFNPVVSLVEMFWKRISSRVCLLYIAAQISGAITGVLVTHAMFGQQLLQRSTHDRSDLRFAFSEVIATFGLIMVISLSGKRDVKATPLAIALFITAAYWCTSSTSFANPAVTIARAFTDTFSGIALNGVPGFIAAQFLAGIAGYVISTHLERYKIGY